MCQKAPASVCSDSCRREEPACPSTSPPTRQFGGAGGVLRACGVFGPAPSAPLFNIMYGPGSGWSGPSPAAPASTSTCLVFSCFVHASVAWHVADIDRCQECRHDLGGNFKLFLKTFYCPWLPRHETWRKRKAAEFVLGRVFGRDIVTLKSSLWSDGPWMTSHAGGAGKA